MLNADALRKVRGLWEPTRSMVTDPSLSVVKEAARQIIETQSFLVFMADVH